MVRFWLDDVAGVMAELRNCRTKTIENTEVEVLPVVDLFQESAKKAKKMWAMQHR